MCLRWFSRLQPLGRLDASANLRLSLNLPLRNQDALTDFLAQLYDPASPAYRHYLSPEEFTARFGPTEQDYATVVAFATSHGFKIVEQHSDRLLLQVSAAVPDIESAFQVKLQTYQHPSENRTFHAPDRDPSVAAGVPILSIGGLDNYARPHPTQLGHSHLPADTHKKNVVGSGPYGLLAGADFRAAYTPGISLQGSGQYVGLVEFDAYYSTDPASYASQTGLTNVPQSIVLLDGFDGQVPSDDNGNNEEVALDIEMAMAMAPALAGIVVYEADPNNGLLSDVVHAMSTNTAVKQFSSSWSEPAITAEQNLIHTYLEKMATQGQTFFCASGDNSAYENGVEIDAPIDDPYVTSVGGTALLTAGPSGAWLGETVWNPGFGPGNGTSGGVSTTYPIPAWQKTVSMTANGGSTTYRNVPDVAMVADNIFIVADEGVNENVGGTSAASPMWAAFTALANEQAANNQVTSVGYLNPTLYHIGTNSAYSACFNDVTIGNNTNLNTTRIFRRHRVRFMHRLGQRQRQQLAGGPHPARWIPGHSRPRPSGQRPGWWPLVHHQPNLRTHQQWRCRLHLVQRLRCHLAEPLQLRRHSQPCQRCHRCDRHHQPRRPFTPRGCLHRQSPVYQPQQRPHPSATIHPANQRKPCPGRQL